MPNVPPRKSASYERVKKYRDNLKKNPGRYDAYKEKERKRRREARIKERKQLAKDERRAQEKRNKKTAYMRKFRAQKKSEAAKQMPPTANCGQFQRNGHDTQTYISWFEYLFGHTSNLVHQ